MRPVRHGYVLTSNVAVGRCIIAPRTRVLVRTPALDRLADKLMGTDEHRKHDHHDGGELPTYLVDEVVIVMLFELEAG